MAQSNRDGMESLEASTRALLDIATQDETAESFSFSQKETEILELYDRVFELKLEEALLNHGAFVLTTSFIHLSVSANRLTVQNSLKTHK